MMLSNWNRTPRPSAEASCFGARLRTLFGPKAKFVSAKKIAFPTSFPPDEGVHVRAYKALFRVPTNVQGNLLPFLRTVYGLEAERGRTEVVLITYAFGRVDLSFPAQQLGGPIDRVVF